jgi:predicted dehydrogenase
MTGFGVIGAGTWGSLHARVYADLPDARLVAVCDTDAGRAAAVATPFGARPYTDYHALLADPEVHAVSIALPDPLHRDAVVAAAEAGKHVLVEKPLATTEADALAMIEAARAAGVTLCVDFHNRFSPLFAPAKRALDAGELGALQLVYYRLNDTLEVPTRMLRWAGSSSAAWFLASHCLDTLLWLLNARAGVDAVERVTCLTRSRVLAAEHGVPTPDFYLTTLEWRSGLVTQIENCWILPECGPSIFDLKCQLIGAKGAVYIDGSHHCAVQMQTARVSYPDALVAAEVQGRPTGFGAESIRHFARCVMEGREPRMDGLDGLAVTRLILAMEESARRREPVTVRPLYDVE